MTEQAPLKPGGPLNPSTGYVDPVPTPDGATGPSALMQKILRQLRDLKRARGLTFEEIEKRGGYGQQVWDKWERGAAAKMESVEATALALDAELVADVRDKRMAMMRPISAGVSPESIEIVAVVDSIPDERLRRRVVEVVHRMAATLSAYTPEPTPPALPPGKPTRRKK